MPAFVSLQRTSAMAKSRKRTKQDEEEEWNEEVWTEEVPKVKLQKKKAAVTSDWQEEAWMEETPAPKKTTKVTKPAKKVPKVTAPKPEELEAGTVVLYWDGWRGVVRDAFVPLDEFWITDEESGDVVRNDDGDIHPFKSAELQLVAGPPVVGPMPQGSGRGPAGGVLLIGSERHMTRMLSHFGQPDPQQRHNPQMLLALPCTMCDPDNLLSVASEGVVDDVRKLAAELRPDIHVALRAFHLKQAIQQLAPDILRMESFYLLTSVSVPYGWTEIERYTGWDRQWREEACNQIDIGVTSLGLYQIGDVTVEDTARRTLGESLGVCISFPLWDEQVQATLRRQLDVDLPLQFTDANDMRIKVLLLPNDAVVSMQDGILGFSEAPDADYLAAGEAALDAADEEDAEEAAAEPETEAKVQGKTIAEWEAEQSQFADQPKLPPNWLRIKSRSSGEVYFWNIQTQKAQFDMPEHPLPDGWTKQKSKSTGKVYYFHAAKKLSQFDRPKA